MKTFKIRTDLAVEANEDLDEKDSKLSGIIVEEEYIKESMIAVTKVMVTNKEGENILNKKKGTYITLEAGNLRKEDEGCHREVSRTLARYLKELLPEKKNLKVLVAGLGNRAATPDALGPFTVDNLYITRHLYMYGEEAECIVSAIAPGVMAQTGMETVEIIRSLVKETKPDAVLVIDALAARSTRRLNSTIQISDAGINPGSGVGNNRNAISADEMGVPVIAVGVPTVVDAASIVNDAMDSLMEALSRNEELKNMAYVFSEFHDEEKYMLIKEVMPEVISSMYVTEKDVDATIKRLSFTISEGINIALNGE